MGMGWVVGWVGRVRARKLKRPPAREVERAGICGRALVNNYQRERAGEGPRGHSGTSLPRGAARDNTSWPGRPPVPPGVRHWGSVTAPRSAPETSRAYLASAPVV